MPLFKEINRFIQNVVSLTDEHQLIVEIRPQSHVEEERNDQIASNVLSAVAAFPSDAAPFAVVSIYLIGVKNPTPKYQQLLTASVVQKAHWLTVHIADLSCRLIEFCKQWLYHTPKPESKSALVAGGALRVLHIDDHGGQLLGNGSNHAFWRLVSTITSVCPLIETIFYARAFFSP